MRLELGECLAVLATIPDGSVDAVVTDPPYGIGFMGHEWDQPGRFSAITANGEPGLDERVAPVARRRRQRQPSAATGAGHHRERAALGGPTGKDNRRHTLRGGAMHAGRYDLSLEANRLYQRWVEEWARECYRVLKPGGYLLSFGGTRTFHRLASGVEDAGFEVRDCIAWLFGSGFPKSRSLSVAMDELAGADRPVVRTEKIRGFLPRTDNDVRSVTEPATPEAQQWEGWGTALKPSFEPIVVGRKPFPDSIARNVLAHGTGGLNIDGCRIPIPAADRGEYERNHSGDRGHAGTREVDERGDTDFRMGGGSAAEGRWPANVILDAEAARELDEQVGDVKAGGSLTGREPSTPFALVYGEMNGRREFTSYGDRGGPSRFFYCAKVSRAERNAGLEGFAELPLNWSSGDQSPGTFQAEGTKREVANHHPTVKPIDLMRWLVRLVTPPGGVVLDPFLGSGTTGVAAHLEGFHMIGIEREEDYMAIARARIAFWMEHGEDGLRICAERDTAERVRQERAAGGQLDLFAEASG